jgi:HAD superfamily hydrolase (TIGR01509 family)
MTSDAPSLVLFDCDGVLVDSEPITNRVFAQMINEVGLPMTREEVLQRFVGRSMPYCFALIEELLNRSLPDNFPTEFRDRSFSALQRELKAVAHIESVLDELDARSIRYAVASSGTHEKMRTTLGITGLLPKVEGRLFSTTEVAHSKPAPDVYLHAAKRMGVAPQYCYVVEDTPIGVAAGVAAGMKVYGYAAFTPAKTLREAGAHAIIDDMRHLPGLWFAHSS